MWASDDSLRRIRAVALGRARGGVRPQLRLALRPSRVSVVGRRQRRCGHASARRRYRFRDRRRVGVRSRRRRGGRRRRAQHGGAGARSAPVRRRGPCRGSAPPAVPVRVFRRGRRELRDQSRGRSAGRDRRAPAGGPSGGSDRGDDLALPSARGPAALGRGLRSRGGRTADRGAERGRGQGLPAYPRRVGGPPRRRRAHRRALRHDQLGAPHRPGGVVERPRQRDQQAGPADGGPTAGRDRPHPCRVRRGDRRLP